MSVAPYLRQDILRNIAMILGAQCNIPPVPRTVWAAMEGLEDNERVRGVMMIERMPGSEVDHVSMCGESFAVCRALLEELDQGKDYHVEVQREFQREFACLFPGSRPTYEGVRLALMPGTKPPSVPHVAEVRRLSEGDAPLVNAFDWGGRPSLAEFVRWEQESPHTCAVFAALLDGRIVGFVQFHRGPVENCAEVCQIAVLPEFRGRGVAKEMLAVATEFVSRKGWLAYYTVDALNAASLRTARALGYAEICRWFLYGVPAKRAESQVSRGSDGRNGTDDRGVCNMRGSASEMSHGT